MTEQEKSPPNDEENKKIQNSEISVAEFLDHCSVFLSKHKLLVSSLCLMIAAIASSGFFVGYWTANNLKNDRTSLVDYDAINDISTNLVVLSDTTQSNFDSQSYFLDTLTTLLVDKKIIDTADAQRLLTGVIIYKYQTADQRQRQKGKSGYEIFSDKIRNRFYLSSSQPFYDPNPDRGIVYSSELDSSIICELILVEEPIGLGLKFVASSTVPLENNRDKYSIQVMVERSKVPENSIIESIDSARKRCK